ncbi:50S ribosomal protein L23 [Candidatus Dojkabacteria bacterium]|nr:50S ribosomal protein L23 [Candidatus Dojkabacteria bacterium]
MKQVLIRPILTEKTINLADDLNQYTFEVSVGANKKNVAEALAEKFDVSVESVKIINRLGKVKRFGIKSIGKRKDTKRAIVRLDKKDKIDLFEMK